MANFTRTALLASTLFGFVAALPSQTATATATIVNALTSSGYNCFSQSSYSESTPAGPLPTPTNMTGFSWNQATNSLSMSSSGSGSSCGFSSPPSSFSRAGTVRLTLVAPYITSYVLSVSGNASSSGTYSTTTVSGALSGMLGGFFNPTTSIYQSVVVPVGPSGTSIIITHSSSSGALSLSSFASANLTVSWTPQNSASATSFGSGCLTAAPTLTSPSPPLLGGNLTADVSGVIGPLPLGLISVGFSNVTSNAGPLPMSLTSIGMTNCTLLQSAEIQFTATPTSATTLSWSTALPATTIFVGVRLYGQAFCLAPGINPLQVVASNGMTWQLGT